MPSASTRRTRSVIPIALFVLGLLAAIGLITAMLRSPGMASVLSGSPACTGIDCDLDIREDDNGKTLRFAIGSRFTVTLDRTKYPQQKMVCTPYGVIGQVTNVQGVKSPLYAARYEIVSAGSCELESGEFKAAIRVDGASGTGNTL